MIKNREILFLEWRQSHMRLSHEAIKDHGKGTLSICMFNFNGRQAILFGMKNSKTGKNM